MPLYNIGGGGGYLYAGTKNTHNQNVRHSSIEIDRFQLSSRCDTITVITVFGVCGNMNV